MATPFAIQIKTPEALPLLAKIYPSVKKMDYVKDLHNKYLLVDFPKKGKIRLMSPKAFRETFKDIDHGFVSVKTNL